MRQTQATDFKHNPTVEAETGLNKQQRLVFFPFYSFHS